MLAIAETLGPKAIVKIRVQTDDKTRETNVSGNDCEARVLISATPVFMAIFIDLKLEVTILEDVEHVGSLETAATRDPTIPDDLLSAIWEPREQPLDVGDDMMLLADFESS